MRLCSLDMKNCIPFDLQTQCHVLENIGLTDGMGHEQSS